MTERVRLWFPAWTTSTGQWFTWASRHRCRTCGTGIMPGCSAWDGTGAWTHYAETFDTDHRPRPDRRQARKHGRRRRRS